MVLHLAQVLSIAMFAATMYAFALRDRAERYRVAPRDQPGARGGLEPEGRALLLRAGRWYRISQGAFWIWVALALPIMVREAHCGNVSWALPVSFVVFLAGALVFDPDDFMAPPMRVYRGFPDHLGFLLRRMRNRVGFSLWVLSVLVFWIWPR